MKVLIAFAVVVTSLLALYFPGAQGAVKTCSQVVPQIRKAGGKWCKAPPLTKKPSRKGLKVGRQTVYAGPVVVHKGICNIPLAGSSAWAGVALSTKYLSANYRGIFPDPFCGRCLCARIIGFDPKYATNPYMARTLAPKYYGKVFKGKVIDQCSECEEEHIDVLTDAPYTYTPVDGSNPKARERNRINGKRIMSTDTAYTVGCWIIEWNFASCNANCNKFFPKWRG